MLAMPLKSGSWGPGSSSLLLGSILQVPWDFYYDNREYFIGVIKGFLVPRYAWVLEMFPGCQRGDLLRSILLKNITFLVNITQEEHVFGKFRLL